MDRFEELMLKISRVFGIVLMSVTLLVITVIVLGLLVNFASGLLKQTTPKVKFYKSDYIEETEEAALESGDKRPEEKYVLLARDAVDSLMPMFTKRLDAYISSEGENLFPDDETRAEKKKAFKEEKEKAFETNTLNLLRSAISEYQEDFQKPYAKGLVKYLEEADSSGIEVFTRDGAPALWLAYNRAYAKYTAEFNRQAWRIRNEDKEAGVADMVAKAGVYGALFFVISIFLFISMMFAIMRIEKKMK
ncbi:MAG: hypothetical protein JW838_00735 [Spirochaetes bacterium]|nr:hypothetical protein [Spirochaetota bacterium]